nr:hypothetical transcript [Hymenolepis microstoma]
MLRPDDAQALHAKCRHSTYKYTHDHIMGRAGDALVAPIMPNGSGSSSTTAPLTISPPVSQTPETRITLPIPSIETTAGPTFCRQHDSQAQHQADSGAPRFLSTCNVRAGYHIE